MPGGTQMERSEYYSAKHKLHGYKTEVSVIPSGIAINCSHHYKGTVADIIVFRKSEDFYVATMSKASVGQDIEDNDPLLDEYPDSWAILTDKGYQGLADSHRAIIPIRRRPSTPLTPIESFKRKNADLPPTRYLVLWTNG